jgi:hypothetical protein
MNRVDLFRRISGQAFGSKKWKLDCSEGKEADGLRLLMFSPFCVFGVSHVHCSIASCGARALSQDPDSDWAHSDEDVMLII